MCHIYCLYSFCESVQVARTGFVDPSRLLVQVLWICTGSRARARCRGSIWRILLKCDWVMVGLPWWSMCICKNRSLCGPIQYSKCSSPSNFQNWSMHFFTHCFVLNISLTCFWEPHGFCLECSQSCVNLWFACIKAAGIHQSRTDSPKPYGFTKAVRACQ